MWDAKQHSYEELRDVTIDVLLRQQPHVSQYASLLEEVAKVINAREGSTANLGAGMAYTGAKSALHPNDRDKLLEIFWDLFRQGIITLGRDDNNPQWPWFRLSRFGKSDAARQPFRFHDASSYIALVEKKVPDLPPETKMYLEEAVSSFYGGCFLAATIMLGVAAEAEFLRMLDVATNNPQFGSSFAATEKAKFIRGKIEAFSKAFEHHRKNFSKEVTEDLDTNLNAVQSIIRIARNEAGHPSGVAPPSREQVYVNLQLFAPYAGQLHRLRQELL
ncbi:hypothetical protein [Labrys neptuniae]|uniref:Uncharacterized protein n=1 Tax=Labrys neptuniae TaxID=376174 RepID=A0ABV3PFY4_9HYPH